ncbi:MAG: beta-ketoacyl-[acyl-carrier-protein] synthase family protein [Flavobacteriia bacterium]|nr:beta-ketoacyl-[acyl-carrier-protein] synthase family protein [Flavobacteriia bacterium]
MSGSIVVSGIGIISAIGNNIEEIHFSLKNGICGIKRAQILKSKYKENFLFGEIPFSNQELIKKYSLSLSEDYTRTDILAEIAFQQAFQDAGWSHECIQSNKTCFISSSTVGGMSEIDELYHDAIHKTNPSVFIQSYAFSAHAKKIVERYEIKGKTAVINTACSSSSNAILLAQRMIEQGYADRAIVGGVDSLSKFTINGFSSLSILSQGYCKAFDQNRDGLNLGESAVYLCLEKESKNTKNYYGKIISGGNANDSFHPSALSDDGKGITLAITSALEKAKLSFENIDFIQAHGTGTPNNDLVETKTMKTLFKRHLPFYSSKTYVGHTLAASGAFGIVTCLLALKNKEIYANLNFQQAIEEINYPPNLINQPFEAKYAMSNAFGFNGNCTSIILQR